MVKGYWTGNLARMVEAVKTGKLEYTIKSNAHYSGFLEYGTRYMAPETFMKPVYEKIAPQIAKRHFEIARVRRVKTWQNSQQNSSYLIIYLKPLVALAFLLSG